MLVVSDTRTGLFASFTCSSKREALVVWTFLIATMRILSNVVGSVDKDLIELRVWGSI